MSHELQFTDVQKAFFPLTALVPVLIGVASWRMVRARKQTERKFDQRLAPLTTLTSGILFGQFLFHIIPRVTLSVGDEYALNTLFILMGFLPMVWIMRLYRYVQINRAFEFSADEASMDIMMAEDDSAIADFQSQRATETSEIEPRKFVTIQEKSRRRAIACIVYAVVLFQSFTDGIWVVFNQENHTEWILELVFWIDKVTESIVIVTVLHMGATSRLWYCLWVALFSLSVGLSTIFPLIPFWDVDTVIHHGVFQVFLGISGGVMFWLSIETLKHDPLSRTDIGRVIVLLFLFTISMAVMWATGYFL